MYPGPGYPYLRSPQPLASLETRLVGAVLSTLTSHPKASGERPPLLLNPVPTTGS